jgi:hypothetical protein
MDVHLKNPELQAKVNHWVAETGRSADELVEDAMAGYFEELAQTRQTLDGRYDDIKSGKLQPVDGEEAFARLRQKSGFAAKTVRERLYPASTGVR